MGFLCVLRVLRVLQRAVGVAVAATVAVTALPLAARAATDTRVRLEYQADEQGGCVPEDELRSMVIAQLGHDPFRADAERTVAITISKTEPGFRGRIVWSDASGRSFGERLVSSRSRDCDEIAANIAFAVGVQLQLIELGASQRADAGGPSPATNGQPERPPATAEHPIAPPAAPEPSSPAPVSLALGLGPSVALGMTPSTTAALRVFVAARYRRLSAELAADGVVPRALDEPDGSGVTVAALGSSAALCGHLSVASACALGRLGWVQAHGTGVDMPKTGWARFNQAGLRVAASRDLGRFAVAFHVDGLVMLARWQVFLNDTAVWTVPRVGALAGLDVALHFF